MFGFLNMRFCVCVVFVICGCVYISVFLTVTCVYVVEF